MRDSFFVRQRDSMQCGVACLTMVCKLLGKQVALDRISQVCFASTEGVSMKALCDAAKEMGLSAKAYKAGIDYLCKSSLPCILHWNQNHFVVLHKIKGRGKSLRFFIADPGKGLCEYSIAEMKEHWISLSSDGEEKGVAMFFNITPRFEAIESDKEADRSSVRFLGRYVRQYKKQFTYIALGLLLGCVFQLVMPFLTQSIVDVGIKNGDIAFIWLVLLGELAIVIGRTVTDFIRRWLLLHISMHVNISLVSDFFIKLLKLPMSFFDTKLMGDLLQRIGDHSRVQNFLTGQMLNVLFTLLSFTIFGIVLLIYNPLIFGVFILGSIAYGLWISAFLKKRKVIDYELFEQQAINQNKTFQFVTSMQEIKLQNCEQRRRQEWEETQVNLFGIQMKSLKLQQTQEAGSVFINEVKNIVITVLAATAVINGHMTLGAMLAVQYIIGQLNSPVAQFMGFIYSFQDVKISLERINEIHQGENEESVCNHLRCFEEDKSIKIRNVDFRYDPHSSRKTLDGISITIPEGKVTAIVGASGSGKTTLIKLLLGYYPVPSGEIIIAGKNISEYNLKWWRSHCGVVMQDGVIFSESIARNIAVADGEIDWPRLHTAAAIANIHEFIIGLPLGYDTKIGRDGVGLSQGQRQRILIARAVYRNPDFIFLDEATNALDAKNERAIVENLAEFYKGRTVVVVAHRLSTVRDADQIVVLDGGRIVETGDHASLIARRGDYFHLVRNQLELGS